MDTQLAALLGIPQPIPVPTKKVNRLDVSACLKDRYYHRMTFQAIADKYGTSKTAVIERLQKFTEQLGDPELLQGFSDVEAAIQTAVKQRYSSHLLSADITKLGAKDAAIVYSLAFDKHRLQTNQSTSNQSVFFHIVDEAGDQLPQDVVPGPIDITPPE